MALPPKLKNFNCFYNGTSWIGLVPEITPPKLTGKFEQYRGGGMLSDVDIDMGLEKPEMEMKLGGMVVDVMRNFGAFGLDGQMLRFNGAYQEEATGGVKAAELIALGRHTEIDTGSAKVGDNTEWTVKSSLVYWKWSVAGRVEVEVDVLNCKLITGGIDRMAEIRAAIGI